MTGCSVRSSALLRGIALLRVGPPVGLEEHGKAT